MTITRQTLAAEYNTIARALGRKELGLAKDLPSAKARLASIQAEAAKLAPKADKPKKEKVAREGKRSGRGMNFNYAPMEWRKSPTPGSMRAKAFDMISAGTTFKEVEALVASEGKNNLETLRYRTLRLIEAIHYSCGYGLVHDRSEDPDTGRITLA